MSDELDELDELFVDAGAIIRQAAVNRASAEAEVSKDVAWLWKNHAENLERKNKSLRQMLAEYDAREKKVMAEVRQLKEHRNMWAARAEGQTAYRNAWFHIAMDGKKESMSKGKVRQSRERLRKEVEKARERIARDKKLYNDDATFYKDNDAW